MAIQFAAMRRLCNRSLRFWMTGGLAVGFVVWAYDYEFFLDAAGPETRISDAILRATHLQHASFPLVVVWPALVLLSGGALIGFVLCRVFGRRD